MSISANCVDGSGLGALALDPTGALSAPLDDIASYSAYEVYHGEQKVCWYDSWEHPEIPALATTFPHHKHVLPNLRENRVPAPGISLASPNLDVVLADLGRDWLQRT